MSDDSNKRTDKEIANQASGWFTVPSPEPLIAGSDPPSNFFDKPPLLFSAFIWLFPYPYIIIVGYTVGGINLFFQAFGLKASDIIPLDLIKALIVCVPFLFFFFISTKGTWFINRIFFLLPAWLFLYWTMGMTQGAVMQALNRAYGIGK